MRIQPSAISHQPSAGRGFTLVEILVVMVIFGGIMGVLLLSFLVGKSSFLSADAYVQVQQEARRALDVMVRELREAGNVTEPDANTLRFQVALGFDRDLEITGCPDGAICWGAQDQSGTSQPNWLVQYRESGTQLVREILNAGAAVQPGTRVLANNVDATNTTLDYVASDEIVTIAIAIRQTSQQLPGGSMQTSPAALQARVRLRN